MKILSKVIRYLVYVLPGVLFFSYYPVISFGSNETMNFEISLPIIWLVIFDIVFIITMVAQRQLKDLWQDVREGWKWLTLPIFITVSILWSANFSRGFLTAGIMWLVVIAIYAILKLKKVFYDDRVFSYVFLRFFIGSTLAVCVWCVVQCVLDVIGVSRDCTLMCRGCVSQMFGFPHPNGFAIEPQFMGNLLLAPIIFLEWRMLHSRPRPSGPSPRADGANSRAAALRNAASLKHYAILLFAFTATLFLTFSRGAIYASVVGLAFMSGFWLVKKHKDILKRVVVIWGVMILAFVFILNIQGLMAEVGPTNDTYASGVAKVLNHLSLGIIDIRNDEDGAVDDVKNKDESANSNENGEEAVFDGYVEESTNIRKELTRNAFKVWRRDFRTILFGVGIGGAGQAMYDEGLTGSPKEIVQNEYVSLLAEVGLVGVVLFAWLFAMAIKRFAKNNDGMIIITLFATYGVSLLFFSGIANALQIYLMPVALYVLAGLCEQKRINKNSKRLVY